MASSARKSTCQELCFGCSMGLRAAVCAFTGGCVRSLALTAASMASRLHGALRARKMPNCTNGVYCLTVRVWACGCLWLRAALPRCFHSLAARSHNTSPSHNGKQVQEVHNHHSFAGSHAIYVAEEIRMRPHAKDLLRTSIAPRCPFVEW